MTVDTAALWRTVRGYGRNGVDAVSSFYTEYRDEILLFVFFVLVFSLTMQWIGVNENTRLDMTRAFADGNLSIDDYHSNTHDKIYHDGHFYGDKAPISSIVGLPAYMIGSLFGPNESVGQMGYVRVTYDFTGDPVVYPSDLPAWLAASQILLILFIGVIPGALLVVFLYRFAKQLYDRRTALWTAFIAGFGTQIYFYSTIGQATILGSLFAFLCFYYAFGDREKPLLSGVFGALAVSTSYYVLLAPVIILGAKLVLREFDFAKGYGAGALIGGIPLFIYAIAAGGTGFLDFLLKTVLKSPTGLSGGGPQFPVPDSSFALISPQSIAELPLVFAIFLKLLFYPSRGLFFYSPALLVGLFAFLDWRRLERKQLFVLPVIYLVSMTVLNAFMSNWYAGAAYGPRYLISIIPFLMVPVAYVVANHIDRVKYVFLVLVAIGLFHNLVGSLGTLPLSSADRNLAPSDALEEYSPGQSYTWALFSHAVGFNSFDSYTSHLSNFMENGAEYRLLTRPLNGFEADIRIMAPEGRASVILGTAATSFIVYNIGWMILPIIGFIAVTVWWRTVWRWFQDVELPRKVVCIIIVVLVLAAPVRNAAVVLGDGFTNAKRPIEHDIAWLEDSGQVELRAQEGVNFLVFDAAKNKYQPRNVTLQGSIDDERLTTATQFARQGGVVATVTNTDRPATASFNITASPGCVQDFDGWFCKSLGFNDEFLERRDGPGMGLMELDGLFYPWEETLEGEFRWMKDTNMAVAAYTSDSARLTVEGNGVGFRPYTDSLRIGGEVVDLTGTSNQSFSVAVPLEKGWNTVSIHPETCVRRTAVTPEANDDRCLSIRMYNFSMAVEGAEP